MNKLFLTLMLVNSLALARELPREMYMPNEADGYVVLTSQDCQFERATKEFPWRAYATEITNGVEHVHEGCWNSPSTVDAPKIKGIKIIPLVNTWWEGGEIATYEQRFFGLEKKRWTLETPPIVVKPTL